MTSSARPVDVLCTGLIVADHVAAPIEAFPAAGTLASTPRTELTIGGCAANVAVNLQKLGLTTGIVACVGDDVLGRFVREVLELHQVDCSFLGVSSTAQTAVTLVVNIQGEDRRFIHAAGANTELTGREITAEMLEKSRLLYVGGFGLNESLSGDHVAELFDRAHLAGVQTALDVVVGDPQRIGDLLAPVLSRTDVFLPNRDEAFTISGLQRPLDQARHFHECGAGTVVVTCGGEGVVLVDNEQTLRSSAFDVPQVDGTGGGDAFAAGFLLGVLGQCDPQLCLRYGAAMGASCVQSPGATTGTFDRAALEAFLRTNDLVIERLSRDG